MKMFSKFLFFYSIAVASLLFIGALFFIPALENFVLALIFLPVVLYFWITITNPGNVSPSKWSVRMIMTVLIFASLGILAYSTVTKNRPAPQTLGEQVDEQSTYSELMAAIDALGSDSNSEELAETLESIQNELAEISADQFQIKQYVGLRDIDQNSFDSEPVNQSNPSSAASIGRITPNGSQKVQVYEEPSITSKTIGELVGGNNYPYFESSGSWYLVSIDNDNLGWVSTQEVKEI